jgi:predicted membrane channel-forming protein YqfA (hemolysin III family)
MLEFLKDSLTVLLAILTAVLVVLFTGALMVLQAFLGVITLFAAAAGVAYLIIGSWFHERKINKQEHSNHSK